MTPTNPSHKNPKSGKKITVVSAGRSSQQELLEANRRVAAQGRLTTRPTTTSSPSRSQSIIELISSFPKTAPGNESLAQLQFKESIYYTLKHMEKKMELATQENAKLKQENSALKQENIQVKQDLKAQHEARGKEIELLEKANGHLNDAIKEQGTLPAMKKNEIAKKDELLRKANAKLN
uniref:Uncharacterized protein n=1 Tax=Entomoneis paludosa TaxID=265537 RepID=A0A7S2VG22_9STRA|eukprot:CAMPEP_0172466648 /NCGR_PEP_ID=MMETSP1065-20121228/56782_1 /TAXON_ID=265537 /ORGANISM="Amphiprora paludosa, Strain CCMP125" /LENGTH=178 /DNA_ID=CAMNT_0013223523 /DNA_START=13 /DNA_END=549 /DNA_ORIENTATION=-